MARISGNNVKCDSNSIINAGLIFICKILKPTAAGMEISAEMKSTLVTGNHVQQLVLAHFFLILA